jgi:hypothetical protein
MGSHSSSNPVKTFAQLCESTITAVSAASSLASMAAEFIGAGTAATVSVSGGDATTLLQRLEDAMDKAKPYCEAAFKAQFGQAPTGTDSGIMVNYSPNAELTNVMQTLVTNFNNWGISLDEGQLTDLLNTIVTQVSSDMGQVSSSFGSYPVDANDTVNWTVAYGTFTQDDEGNVALIYGFSAQEVGAFKQ